MKINVLTASILLAITTQSAFSQTASTTTESNKENSELLVCEGASNITAIDPITHLPYSTGNSVLTDTHTISIVQNRVVDIEVEVSGKADANGMLAADGISLVPVNIKLLDSCGQLVKGKIAVRIEAKGVKIAPNQSDETVRLIDPAGKELGVDVINIVDGEGEFKMISPSVSTKVDMNIFAGDQRASGEIYFAPDLRPLIAVGLIDGVIHLSKKSSNAVLSAGINDGFERELTRFQRDFNNGHISVAGRTAFFIKGKIKGDTLLTASFDSEKEKRQRTLDNINPDKYYPVLGDSSTKGMEAQSSDRLYVRLDNGRNYALYGDFLTSEGFSQSQGMDQMQVRNLGLYNRTMTGLRGHRELDKFKLDAFVMNDSLRQSVEEYRSNGTSGPYSVANLNAVENTEKLEVIVRDRHNSSRIISTTSLVRYVDYTFEPFSGRILLKSSLASFDESLNPISLRITYEVDSGGKKFWVYGFSAQTQLTDNIEVGANYIKDNNPEKPIGLGFTTVPGQGTRELRELVSVNSGIKLGETGELVVEVARSTSATALDDVTGNAYRMDWSDYGKWNSPWDEGLAWNAAAYWGDSDSEFNNPAASYTGGRSEVGVRTVIGLTEKTALLVDARHTEDKNADTYNDGQALRIEHQLDSQWRLNAGVRHIRQSEGAVTSFSTSASSQILPGQASAYSGEGLNPAGAGFWGSNTGLNPVTGQPQSMLNGQLIPSASTSQAIDAWTVQAGADYQYTEQFSVGSELGYDHGFAGDPYWVALNANYQSEDWRLFGRAEAPTGRVTAGGDYNITDKTSLYGRFENTNGLSSGYNLDSGVESRAFIVGLKQNDGQGLENFNEYRLRDGMNGQETENATGLRNTFELTSTLKANVAAEHLRILSGGGRSATALAGGLEWTKDAWRGSMRLEWRQLERSETSLTNDTADSILSTFSLARKLDSNWTGLFKNYLLLTDQRDLSGNQLQNRFQLGLAYRPINTNNFDALMRYENKFERNQEITPNERRNAHVMSANVNFHPSRDWTYMGRVAGKYVTETLQGVSDDYLAWLLSGRVIVDLTSKFDLGVMTSLMGSPQGNTLQYAYGLEGGYLVASNVWGSVGYNLSGFNDNDLTGSDYTSRGVYLRLRIKF